MTKTYQDLERENADLLDVLSVLTLWIGSRDEQPRKYGLTEMALERARELLREKEGR